MTDDTKMAVAPDVLPMSAIERVAEILEALFNLERDLTAELLAELARCDVNDLVRLFGGPPSANAAARARNKADMSVDGAERQTANAAATADGVAPPPHVVEQPGVTLLQANPPEPQWDANGYRIGSKLPSAFPRCYEPPRPRGTHWSR